MTPVPACIAGSPLHPTQQHGSVMAMQAVLQHSVKSMQVHRSIACLLKVEGAVVQALVVVDLVHLLPQLGHAGLHLAPAPPRSTATSHTSTSHPLMPASLASRHGSGDCCCCKRPQLAHACLANTTKKLPQAAGNGRDGLTPGEPKSAHACLANICHCLSQLATAGMSAKGGANLGAHHSSSFCSRRVSTTPSATAGFLRTSSPMCEACSPVQARNHEQRTVRNTHLNPHTMPRRGTLSHTCPTKGLSTLTTTCLAKRPLIQQPRMPTPILWMCTDSGEQCMACKPMHYERAGRVARLRTASDGSKTSVPRTVDALNGPEVHGGQRAGLHAVVCLLVRAHLRNGLQHRSRSAI